MGESPVRVEVLTQLQHHGIPPEQITYPRVNLSSPRRLCVRHGPPQDPTGARVTLLDPREPHGPATHSWPLHQAQGALAHPSQPLLALRAGCVAQVFDVAQRCLCRQWTFAHPLQFWAWLEPETLALVTEEDVFHWALSRPKPRRAFRRQERLWCTEVVGYQRDASGLWLALSTLGLDQKGQVVGLTQLHWRGGRLSQVIEAQAVALPRHSFSRNPHPSSALLAAVRHGTERHGQFHVVELGPHQPGNAALLSARASLAFKGARPGDFPSAVQFAPRLGLALVLTKHTLLFLADVETAQPLHRVQLAWDIVFATVPDPPCHGLVGVCRSGKVLSVALCPDSLLQLLSRRPASLYLTQRLLQLVGRAAGLCKASPSRAPGPAQTASRGAGERGPGPGASPDRKPGGWGAGAGPAQTASRGAGERGPGQGASPDHKPGGWGWGAGRAGGGRHLGLSYERRGWPDAPVTPGPGMGRSRHEAPVSGAGVGLTGTYRGVGGPSLQLSCD